MIAAKPNKDTTKKPAAFSSHVISLVALQARVRLEYC